MYVRTLAILVCLSATIGSSAAAEEETSRTIALAAATALEDSYVFPTAAKSAATQVRARADAGAYDALTRDALAMQLTQDVSILHDRHLRVSYSPEALPPANASAAGPSPQQLAAMESFEREHGYGLTHLAHLPGNVGYVGLRFFAEDSPNERRVLDGIADAIGTSAAIIIDLRKNNGGSPASVDRILSHLLPPKTHLNDFIGRGDANAPVRDAYYTASVPGAQIAVPVHVLTSAHTFSAAEEFAYDLQTLRRATMVGETTGGGANPGSDHRLGDHFEMFVPDARARNPITLTNWDGVGVKPDVAVPADRALATAYRMALAASPTPNSADPRDESLQLRAKIETMSDAEILAL